MRGSLVFLLTTALVGGGALAQNAPPASDPTSNPAANSAVSNPTAAAPAQLQPQGHPGRINTTSGGGPASSPQGDSPPGMQPRPNDPKQGVAPRK
jgi:hypothetical protein